MAGAVLGKSAHVLVAAVDLSAASTTVFEAALEVANDAPEVAIHLVHVSTGKGVKTRKEDAVEALARWAERLPDHASRVELHAVENADAADGILDFAEKVRADVILIGTHGRSGLSRVLVGSVAEKVVRSAGCSVHVVREKSYGRTRAGATDDV